MKEENNKIWSEILKLKNPEIPEHSSSSHSHLPIKKCGSSSNFDSEDSSQQLGVADRLLIKQVNDFWFGAEHEPSWDRNSIPKDWSKMWFQDGEYDT